MITYRKYPFGLSLLLRLYGSTVLRCSVFGVIAAIQTLLLYLLMPDSERRNFYYTGVSSNPTFPAFATMLAFLIVFRQQFAYNRFRQGRTELQSMTASLFTVVSSALAFDRGYSMEDYQVDCSCDAASNPHPNDPQRAKGGSTQDRTAQPISDVRMQNDPKSAAEFRNSLLHLTSLLHGVCVQHLRNDWEINNLTTHDENVLPPWDSGNSVDFNPRLIHYLLPPWNRIKSRVRWNGRSKIGVIGGISWTEKRGLRSFDVVQTSVIPPESVHRTRGSPSAFDVEGHQRSEEMVTGNTRVTKKKSSDKVEFDGVDRNAPRGTVPRCSDPKPPLKRSKSLGSRLWSSDTGDVVRGASERPYQLFFALSERLRKRIAEGGLDMPAPILATLWQTVSASIQSFEACRYLQDTPFPFPWAQLNVAVLVVWQVVTPFAVTASLQNRPIGITLSVVATWLAWAINESSRDMEDPFVMEPNDLPLARLQYSFNQRLLAAAYMAEIKGGLNVFFTGASAMENSENTVQTYQGGVDTTVLSGVVGV